MTHPEGKCGPRRGPTALVLTVAFAIAVTGCSSAEDQATEGSAVGDAFAERALSVCAEAQESKDAWDAFPVSDFDPRQPDVSDLPEVGAWLHDEVGPTFDAWRDDLTALGKPPTGRKAWTDVLTAVGKIAHLNALQVDAATSGDTDAFAEATNGLQQMQSELERATAAAGVAKCAEVHAD